MSSKEKVKNRIFYAAPLWQVVVVVFVFEMKEDQGGEETRKKERWDNKNLKFNSPIAGTVLQYNEHNKIETI